MESEKLHDVWSSLWSPASQEAKEHFILSLLAQVLVSQSEIQPQWLRICLDTWVCWNYPYADAPIRLTADTTERMQRLHDVQSHTCD